MLFDIIFIIALLFIDQFTKFLVVTKIPLYHSVPIIKNFFSLTYVQNRGVAFGLFNGDKNIVILITIAFLVFIFIFLSKIKNKKYILVRIAVLFITGGALGNLSDRIFRGFVVDFYNFHGVWNYIFNSADVFINIGVGLLIIYYIKTEFFAKKDNK